MKTLLLVILLAAAQSLRAEPVSEAQPLRIAAAANLAGTLEEVAQAFVKASPEAALPQITYGASGSLTAQIEEGAPYDLFLAADRDFPERVAAKGLAQGATFLYARGKLALWVPQDSPLEIEKLGLKALQDPRVTRIAIGNPKLAPYGKLSMEALAAAGLDDPKRLALGESVGQAAQFAQSGNAQASLIPLSLALGIPGRHLELPGTIEQRGVILKSAREMALARRFVDFLQSGDARAILARRGYGF